MFRRERKRWTAVLGCAGWAARAGLRVQPMYTHTSFMTMYNHGACLEGSACRRARRRAWAGIACGPRPGPVRVRRGEPRCRLPERERRGAVRPREAATALLQLLQPGPGESSAAAGPAWQRSDTCASGPGGQAITHCSHPLTLPSHYVPLSAGTAIDN